MRQLKAGEQLHVYGIPRLDFAELARRIDNGGAATTPSQSLPYEILILGVYPK